MHSPRCTFCRDSLEPGWLCAEHSGRPWGHDDCGAEGARCVCNPTGAILGGEVIAEVEALTEAELAEVGRALTPNELLEVERIRALKAQQLH
ncbi:MAG: hypothetical protein K8R60_04440 [Burkholderiales bacterium]|nr:hypothetical protein [Burkholderiales bacterium]